MIGPRKYQGELVHFRYTGRGPIEVVDDGAIRRLHFGDDTPQSAMYLHHPDVLVLAYTQHLLSSLILMQDPPGRVLIIGLGGASLPKFLLMHYPDCRIDVVELRAEVLEVAHSHFELPHSDHLLVYCSDGLDFVRTTSNRYDLLVLDAYAPSGIPDGFASASFYDHCRARLTSGGLLAANLSRAQPLHHRLALKSLGKSFPDGVLRLPVPGRGNEIALAGLSAPGLRDADLDSRAGRLKRHLGLDFPGYLKSLRRENGSAWRRWLRV